MTWRRFRRALLVAIGSFATVASLLTLAGPAAHAQGRDRLDLVSQTTFVTDDPVVIDVRVPNITDGSKIRVRVDTPVEDADMIADLWEAPPASSNVANYLIENLDELTVGAGDIISITLPEEEIGLFLRREPGALPVRLDLLDADDTVLDTLVTAVIVEDTTLSARIDIGFVADARVPLAHGIDGIAIDPDATLQRVADTIADAPGPALVAFSPETLTALADPAIDGGLAAIDDIRTALDDQVLSLAPWVSLDEEAWRLAGESDRVIALYARGQRTVEQFLGRSPISIVWMDHDTTPDTISLLRSVGVSAGIVEPDQLDAPTLTRADNRPVEVLDANGVTMPVLVIDRAFEDSLVGDDPELIAQHRFTELLFEAKAVGTDRAIVLDLDTVDRISLTLLLDLVADTNRIGIRPLPELITRPPARDAAGAVLRVPLAATEPGDVVGTASDLRLTESILESYTTMVATAEGPIESLRTRLLAATSDELDADERRAYTDSVFTFIVDGTGDFGVVEAGRITLATRSATLPVTIRNDQSVPINVIVRIRSEKLRFPGGEALQLTLEPGLNELDVPVETVASGDSRIAISITSPDGRLDLADGAINVRSTAVSGLGLIVSLISLAVLLTWWLRTIVRVRRTRRTASVSDGPSADGGPNDEPAEDPDEEPAEEEEPAS